MVAYKTFPAKIFIRYHFFMPTHQTSEPRSTPKKRLISQSIPSVFNRFVDKPGDLH